MKTIRPLTLVAALLVLAALACSSEGMDAGSTGPTTNILFRDDFSDPVSGWIRSRDDTQILDYENDGFRIWVNQANFDYWSVPGLNFTDVRVEVDATRSGGPDDNNYGIICRYKDADNFYGFLVSSDGYYGISIRQDGDHHVIGAGGMQVSQVIKTGAQSNHIRADCIGSTLTLYVNGEKLAEVQDSNFAEGDIGLIAGSFDTPGVDILFDNLVASKP